MGFRLEEDMADSNPPPVEPGYVRDYISGLPVPATPEELDAVQVLARRLVEDFGYPREHIRTRPQHRVRKSPSDDRRTYPVDIAVFASPDHQEQTLQMIAECKRKDRRTGLRQLEIYMAMSLATVGIWFNGKEHAYVRKIARADGTLRFEEIPSVPRFGERLDDVGKHRRSQLTRPTNLRATFRDLRNHLAANAIGITRDEALAQEIINLLFCKIYDEINSAPDDLVRFRSGIDEDAETVHDRIVYLFQAVKEEYPDVFDSSDRVSLDPASTLYVVGEIQNYCVTEADRDAIGDAFEVFIGPALRGAEGQFFTPRNVVQLMVDLVDPKPGESVIDPACGSGGFLISALAHIWASVDSEGESKAWSDVQVDRRKRDIATRYFRGADKDRFLARVTKAYMALVGDGRGGVFCENMLAPPDSWEASARARMALGTFDVVLTNPPFGSKISVEDAQILGQYTLARKWQTDRETGIPQPTQDLNPRRPPQVLFLERCLSLLKPGGRLGIILPESMLGSPSHRYVREFLMGAARIRGIIAMPEPLFKTSGRSGTHTKVCVVLIENVEPSEPHDIFVADAEWCGHDSRSNPTIRRLDDGTEELLDDVPLIAKRFREIYGDPRSFWDEME